MARTRLRPALALLLALLALTEPAAAFDCTKARGPIETAICADPAAKASDEAMVAAFERVRGGAPADQRQPLLDNQRAWLKQRNRDCSSEKPTACLSEANRQRTAILLAQPESGPGIEPRPVPVFVQQAGGKTKIEVSVQLYRFAQARSAGERFLNAEADKAIAGIALKKDEPDDRDWTSDLSWTIAYASPAFVSIRVDTSDYSGGAHGSSGSGGLNIDMRNGRAFTLPDLFDARGQSEIGKLCLAQVKAEKRERGADGEDDPKDLRQRIDDVLKDLANWSFTETTATVHFDQYSIGSYAEGPYTCELATKQLSTLSKSPLPPR